MERENLLAEATRLEGDLAAAFAPLAELNAVTEVRTGLGAVTGVQLADPYDAPAAALRLRANGVAGRAAGLGALQVSPAFVMTTAEVNELAERFTQALS